MAKQKIHVTGKDVLEKFGATNIERYCLISNFGYTFELDGKKYDARFWANSYGYAMNVWKIHSLNPREDDPRFFTPIDPDLKKKLGDALNACDEK